MQVVDQFNEDRNAITHSPYYGCTLRVLSKAKVSYEGELDGISSNKDRIFLKNVRVNANVTSSPSRNNALDDLNNESTSDTLNAVMIDHLTKDIHIYKEVCLNVRDIQELRLIQLPSTFHESKTKLRAIDPCLLDIRLSSSDEHETKSTGSNNDPPSRASIGRQIRGESFASNGDSAIISLSSNDSTSSSGIYSSEKFADESNDESIDEQIEKLNRLTIETPQYHPKPVTLLAKKVLPKRIERRSDIQSNSSMNTNNSGRQTTSDHREIVNGSTRVNNHQTLKKGSAPNENRKLSPLRVTITSKLNPDATPFVIQQRNIATNSKPSFTFYERPHFRPRLQPFASPDGSQSSSNGVQPMNNNNNNHQPHHQQQQHQNYPHSNQRYIPPRQMGNKKNFTQTNLQRTKTRSNRTPPPMAKYRIHSSTNLDKRILSQQQYNNKVQNNLPPRPLTHHRSNQSLTAPTVQERLSLSRNNPVRQSITSIRSTSSLPYQYGAVGADCNQMHAPLSFQDSIGSYRSQRTFSGASSCSSASLDIISHSIHRADCSSNPIMSFKEQYDFEKANEEFRRYLELEELVIRRPSPNCSTASIPDDNTTDTQIKSRPNSYKKEVSFFDRISCTATTGTAVGYTEMDENEKNLETFGNDALLMASSLNDNEWQI